jgi:PIN domain nuclease of toxin-antitoxin system
LTHAWIQRPVGGAVPVLAERTSTQHADTLAIADISPWEAAKLVELGRLELSVPLSEFFRLAITPELTPFRSPPPSPSGRPLGRRPAFLRTTAKVFITGTALVHKLRLVSDDRRIRQWGGVPMLWRTSRG